MQGDLSNSSLPSIAFNADELLFKDLPKTRLESIKRKFRSNESNYFSRDININFIMYLRTVWEKGYNVGLLTKEPYKFRLYSILNDYKVCYTYLDEVTQSELEESKLHYYYYVCKSPDVKIPNSITLSDLQALI